MLTIFGKKKLAEEKLTNVFVNSILDVVETGFEDVAGLINEAPEFPTSPQIKPTDSGHFALIVIAANLKMIPYHFDMVQSKQLIEQVTEKFAVAFNMPKNNFAKMVSDTKSFMSRVNHPSKNVLYSMSKAMFFKYELTEYQDEYFRNMKAPNPLFLKRLDDVMQNFLWDWDTFLEKHKIT